MVTDSLLKECLKVVNVMMFFIASGEKATILDSAQKVSSAQQRIAAAVMVHDL